MKKAVIIGCNGQDGILLSEFLKSKDYHIAGISHHFKPNSNSVDKYLSFDLSDSDFSPIHNLIQQEKPDELYYLAAYHFSSQGSFENNSDDILKSALVNYIGFQRVCDICKNESPQTKIAYTSSSLIFAGSGVEYQDEQTEISPKCYYSMHKHSSMLSAKYYRSEHDQFISIGIMYNHESIYRKDYYLSKRIINQVKSLISGEIDQIVIGNLDSVTDWSSASDMVRALWHILQLPKADTFILSSGIGHRVKDWFTVLENHLNRELLRNVEIDDSIITRKKPTLIGNNVKLLNTGWKPKHSFEEMVVTLFEESK